MAESTIDLATALDSTLQHPSIEAKYQKLRLFSAEKIKSLLGTVDNQTKKLKEYRGGPSDGRTATIKALKGKLRDQEFVADVLKEDLLTARNKAAEREGERGLLQIKNINQEVIDETIGGPKRFRQLTREEIENNLIELEILEKQYREQPVVEKKLTSRQRAVAARSSKQTTAQADESNYDEYRVPESPDKRMYDLQCRSREQELGAQQEKIQQLLEEMDRIRSSNAEHRVKKENSALVMKDYEELTISMNSLDVTLRDVHDRLRDGKAELAALKEKQRTEADVMIANIERGKKEANKALVENNELLAKMLQIEKELDNAMGGALYGDIKNNELQPLQQSDAELDALEIGLTKQLQTCRERKRNLEDRVGSAVDLREQLREKNEEYRILKRDMTEVAKTKLSQSKNFHK